MQRLTSALVLGFERSQCSFERKTCHVNIIVVTADTVVECHYIFGFMLMILFYILLLILTSNERTFLHHQWAPKSAKLETQMQDTALQDKFFRMTAKSAITRNFGGELDKFYRVNRSVCQVSPPIVSGLYISGMDVNFTGCHRDKYASWRCAQPG